MLLIIDNYDSFTYNLYQAFAEIDPDVRVVKNDAITLEEIKELKPSGIVISPGPGRPEESGVSIEAIREFAGKIPLFGVCLGHQAMAVAFGGKVGPAPTILHGKESLIFHTRKDLYKNLSLPFTVGRYHSLVVTEMPVDFEIDAETPDQIIMGMRHKKLPIFGVQFHPESILTPEGKTLMKNFIEMCKCKS